jgi:hypothetical protein
MTSQRCLERVSVLPPRRTAAEYALEEPPELRVRCPRIEGVPVQVSSSAVALIESMQQAL